MVTVEDFISIWQSAESVAEVANKTNLSLPAIYARARRYRKHGFELKRYRLPYQKLELINGQTDTAYSG